MASSDLEENKLKLEEELKELTNKNTELVQKVQFWKMKSAQQEADKLDLMKENNDLRHKLSRMRTTGASQARALDSAVQAATEEALSHLVQASSAVAHTVELIKNYMRDRQELENISSRWSTLSVTPVKERVNKVPPLTMGGRSIQPYVSLNRVPLSNRSNNTPAPRNPNQNVTERVLPLPMHLLQDVYIPLRRIDPTEYVNSPNEQDNIEDESAEDLIHEDSAEIFEDFADENDEENFDATRPLDVLHEDNEEEQESAHALMQVDSPVTRMDSENPLEGPSWLLDRPNSGMWDQSIEPKRRVTLEADSTTELEESVQCTPPIQETTSNSPTLCPTTADRRVFTPTVRRRKRTSSPPPDIRSPDIRSPDIRSPDIRSPVIQTHKHTSQPYRRNSVRSRMSGKVLKVVVPKIALEDIDGSGSLNIAGHSPRNSENSAASVNSANNSAICANDSVASVNSADNSPICANNRAICANNSAICANNSAICSNEGVVCASSADGAGDSSPPKRPVRFDAPSPNGTTDNGVIVMESIDRSRANSLSSSDSNLSTANASAARDSEGNSRTRRTRKKVTYKEKPLNRKLRR